MFIFSKEDKEIKKLNIINTNMILHADYKITRVLKQKAKKKAKLIKFYFKVSKTIYFSIFKPSE